ncbi:MAG: hypothetical protein ACK5MK_02695 [Dysgonomonas sp.]
MKKISLICTLSALLLIGCKTKTVYIPVESVKTEYKNNYLRDSIYLHDSVSIYQRGDTVFRDKLRYIFTEKVKTDSVYIHDSIPYIKEVTVKGDTIYKMKWYEEVIFYVGLAVVATGLGYAIVRYLKK